MYVCEGLSALFLRRNDDPYSLTAWQPRTVIRGGTVLTRDFLSDLMTVTAFFVSGSRNDKNLLAQNVAAAAAI